MIARRPVIRPVRMPLRPLAVPIVSTLAGSAMILAPMVSSEPELPPLGLLMLLSWRLLRPEMWPAWIALPLGLFDDLMTGHFLGTSMMLWTMAFLAFDWIDHHVVWRDYWMEWIIAAASITIIQSATWAFSQTPGATGTILSVLPETIVAILIFPAIVRLTAALDRWRLAR